MYQVSLAAVTGFIQEKKEQEETMRDDAKDKA